MGPDGAVNIVFRKELETADDPDARRAELVEEYREQFANPFTAAERGYVDDVIAPRRTRPVLITALEASAGKRTAPPKARQHPAVSEEQIDVTPEPTPEEKEAIRRALEALGLVEAGPPDPSADPGSGTAPSTVADP